jgi:hypothetical protein
MSYSKQAHETASHYEKYESMAPARERLIKFLGWRFQKSSFEQVESSYYLDEENTRHDGYFNPFNDIRAAFKLLDRCRDSRLTRTRSGWTCVISLVELIQDANGVEHEHRREVGFSYASAPMAITIAVLTALDTAKGKIK